MRASLKLPADKRLLSMIDAALQQLSEDRDQETLNMLAQSKAQIEKFDAMVTRLFVLSILHCFIIFIPQAIVPN